MAAANLTQCSLSPLLLRAHLHLLLDLGLTPIPTWGQSKLLPGTNLRELAASPPSAEAALAADYSGGLSIICGTEHPLGVVVLGLDVDRGPSWWPAVPRGFLFLEAGTAPGKAHLFIRSADRLEGQLNLRGGAGDLVCEVKGAGHALRSWPTRPSDKPKGYTPYAAGCNLASDPPALTAMQVAQGMADFLSHVLGEGVQVELQTHHGPHISGRHWEGNLGLSTLIKEALAARGTHLGPQKWGGWQLGRCPFHQDCTPSFSVSFELGAWKCWGGCGAGYLSSLAERLGIRVYRWQRGHPVLPVVEV